MKNKMSETGSGKQGPERMTTEPLKEDRLRYVSGGG